MEKLMEVLEAYNIDKHGVVLLGQNGDLDVLTEEKFKQYIGDSITLCLTTGDTFKLKVTGIDRMYACFSPESPLIIGICVGHAIDSVNIEKGSVVYIPKNNPFEYFQVLYQNSAMDELTKYLFDNYSHLLTIQENMAWRHYTYIAEGHKDIAESFRNNYKQKQGIEILINAGEEEFYSMVKNRILREHSQEISLNYCPKCGSLARTPRAKQCLKCKYDWH